MWPEREVGKTTAAKYGQVMGNNGSTADMFAVVV